MFKTIEGFNEYEDLFTKLNIDRKLVDQIIKILESNEFIETHFVRSGSHYFDHENKEYFKAEIKLIRITTPGELFINSTSFTSNYLKDVVYKNLPILISVLSLALSIYSYVKQENSTMPKLEKLELRLKDLEKTKNQGQTLFPQYYKLEFS